jgi:transcriptional regulator with XRE-family HTH domain
MKGPVSQRIKFLRAHLGLSQAEFAAKINLTQGAVAAMETGRSQPSKMALNAISTQYSVNTRWLEDGDGEMLIPVKQETPEVGNAVETIRIIERLQADHQRDKQQLYEIISYTTGLLDECRALNREYMELLKKHKVPLSS